MAIQPLHILTVVRSLFEENQNNHPLFHQASIANPWFTPEQSQKAFKAWTNALSEDKIKEWLNRENLTLSVFTNKKVGLILPGNLPLVGLHDLLCTILCGHIAEVKLSSQDTILMKWIIAGLTEQIPELKDRININEGFVKNANAYIGTGSNNSARYFEYYFKETPHIIRKNRNSAAIIEQDCTDSELTALGQDVFNYFGMGCRNVTHLFLPEGFDFSRLFTAWEIHRDIINHHKYANNYTYHKVILLMNLDKHIDNGFLIMIEREQISSPVAILSYSYYTDKSTVTERINSEAENLQCVATRDTTLFPFAVPFGKTQEPELWDYADGINTLAFLKNI